MRNFLNLILISVLLLSFAASCAWMGEMAGKTVATGKNIGETVGEKAGESKENLKKGYEKGYEETKKD